MRMESTTESCCSICYEELCSKGTKITEILELFEFLISKINIKLLRDSLICESCLTKVKSAYKFKTLYTENSQQKSAKEEGKLEKYVLCEICKNIIDPSDCIPLNNSAIETKLNVIKYLSLDLESEKCKNSQTCELCHKSLLTFCAITNSLSIFDQDNICSGNIVCKSEIDNENVEKLHHQTYTNLSRANYNEENTSIDIKKEVKISQIIKEEKEDSTGYEDFLIKNEEVNLKMQCDEDPEDEMIWKHTEKEKNSTVSNNKTYKCQTCQFETKYRSSISKHLLTHKTADEIEMYQCPTCKFQSKRKDSLKKHLLTHNNRDKLKMFSCDQCDYQTKLKMALMMHKLIHERTDETLRCKVCSYETKYKQKFNTHLLSHENSDEIVTFKCTSCDFQSKRKSGVRKHMALHESKFLCCQQCTFKTKRKDSLKKHQLMHTDSNEMKMFQCELCDFQTIYYEGIKNHRIVHKNSDEVKMFECEVCGFRTKHSKSLKKHLLTHKSASEVELFKCQLCKYETRYKVYLKEHSRIHKTSEMFQCYICEHRTKRKSALRAHMLIHRRPDEVEMLRCQVCKFQTRHKFSLKKHMRIHENSKKENDC